MTELAPMFVFLVDNPLGNLFARFAIDLLAMSAMMFGLYYPRYRDKELVTTAALFNIFVFAVLTVLSSVDFGVAAGFGLFAILALFTLRSEPIGKIEITYFFGSVALAVICAVQGTSLPTVATIALIVLAGAWLLDHPRILHSVDGVRITLDKIDPHALSDPDVMRMELSSRLGVEVMSFHITALDYITDMARINVYYRKPQLPDDRAASGRETAGREATGSEAIGHEAGDHEAGSHDKGGHQTTGHGSADDGGPAVVTKPV